MKKPSSKPAPGARAASKSSPDIVFDAIITAIQNSTLVPGQRLVEADLTESLGVSRGPVREALKRLAAEGIVTLNQNRGAFVRALNRKDAHDLLQILEVTCGLGAKLAARQVSKGYMLEEFDAACKELLAHEDRGDSQSFIVARREFYDVLFRASGNQELQRVIPLMQIHLLRLQFQTLMTEPDRSKQFDEYRAVIAAIRAGQFVRAERLMRIHIWRSRLSISRLDNSAFHAGVDRLSGAVAAG